MPGLRDRTLTNKAPDNIQQQAAVITWGLHARDNYIYIRLYTPQLEGYTLNVSSHSNQTGWHSRQVIHLIHDLTQKHGKEGAVLVTIFIDIPHQVDPGQHSGSCLMQLLLDIFLDKTKPMHCDPWILSPMLLSSKSGKEHVQDFRWPW